VAEIGAVFAGYELESELARSDLSVLYRARDISLERPAAVKVMAAELQVDRDYCDLFMRQARLASSVEHPNLIPIYDIGDVDGQLFVAMRFVAGRTLRDRIAEGPLSGAEAVELLRPVASALDEIHGRGQVHGDVKPDNVLIGEGSGVVYLTDFGLTKERASAKLTRPGTVFGNVDYAAPEQLKNEVPGPAVDVFALAAVAFECITGTRPFERGRSFASIFQSLPTEAPSLLDRVPVLPGAAQLDAVLHLALSTDIVLRPVSCSALLDQLSGVATTESGAAVPEPQAAPDPEPQAASEPEPVSAPETEPVAPAPEESESASPVVVASPDADIRGTVIRRGAGIEARERAAATKPDSALVALVKRYWLLVLSVLLIIGAVLVFVTQR
jgi:serine/threonine protein kinase